MSAIVIEVITLNNQGSILQLTEISLKKQAEKNNPS